MQQEIEDFQDARSGEEEEEAVVSADEEEQEAQRGEGGEDEQMQEGEEFEVADEVQERRRRLFLLLLLLLLMFFTLGDGKGDAYARSQAQRQKRQKEAAEEAANEELIDYGSPHGVPVPAADRFSTVEALVTALEEDKATYEDRGLFFPKRVTGSYYGLWDSSTGSEDAYVDALHSHFGQENITALANLFNVKAEEEGRAPVPASFGPKNSSGRLFTKLVPLSSALDNVEGIVMVQGSIVLHSGSADRGRLLGPGWRSLPSALSLTVDPIYQTRCSASRQHGTV